MRSLIVSLITLSFFAYGQPEKLEIEKEIKRLEKIREEIKQLIQKNEKILKDIEEQRKKLAKEKEELNKLKKEILDERYKKLAKMFEKMEPEIAGEKISNMEDPKKAAYIIYNMKESKAGAVLDNTSPDMVNQIVQILTQLKKKEKN